MPKVLWTANKTRKLRKKLGWSQTRLAAFMHVHSLTVSRWEAKGKRRIQPVGPTIVLLQALWDAQYKWDTMVSWHYALEKASEKV